MKSSLKIKSIANVIGQVVQFSSSLIMTPFIIKTLGEQFFGLWVLFNTIIGFEGFFLAGTTQSLNRYIPFFLGKEDHDSWKSIIRSHFFFYFLISFLLFLSIYLFSDFFFHFFNLPENVKDIYNQSLPVLFLALSISFFNKIFVAINNGEERFVELNIISIVVTIVRLTVIILFAHKGFIYLIYALVLANSTSLILLFLRRFSSFKKVLHLFNPLDDLKILRLSLIFGAGTLLMYIADILRFQVDSFLIVNYLNLETLTQYKIGTTLLSTINSLNIGFFGVLISRLSFHQGKGELDRTLELSKKSFFYSSLLASFFILGMVFMAKSFLTLWIGNFHPSSLQIVYILAFPQLILITQYPSINILYSINKHRYLGTITFIESVLNFTISYILIQKIGVIGVVIGTGVGFVLSKGIIIPLLLRKNLNFTLKEQIQIVLPNFLIGLLSTIIIFYTFSYWKGNSTIAIFLLKCFFISIVFYLIYNLFYNIKTTSYASPFLLKNILRRLNDKNS